MTYDINYTPVLRSKQAEFDALQRLKESDRALLLPLFDILPVAMIVKKQFDITEGLIKLARNIDKSWHTYPIMVDVRRLNFLAPGAMGRILLLLYSNLCRLEKPLNLEGRAPLIPVGGLVEDKEYEAIVRTIIGQEKAGVSLRLSASDIRRKTLATEIERFLERLGCAPNETNVVVDLKFIEKADVLNLADISSRLPYLFQWKNIVVAAGSFPKDLSDLKAGEEHELPRHEWCAWHGQMVAEIRPERYIGFGDYGIYHPNYVEPPPGATPSASIRYTGSNYWIVMRGRKARKGGPGNEQYMQEAVALCERDEYRNCGPNYSAGDAYIGNMAQACQAGNTAHPGNAGMWLNAGFNHHLTLTSRQVAQVRSLYTSGDSALAA